MPDSLSATFAFKGNRLMTCLALGIYTLLLKATRGDPSDVETWSILA